MDRVTIEVQDDGMVSITAELAGAEPESLEFDSVSEALSAVNQMLGSDEMPEEMPEESAEMMWDEEASKRPKSTGLMA